ncbi:MAG: NADH-quinone oxidoreductase subunit L [Chitinophagaceae bacterium]|nr:NADH-quinone oxidoreductase subunit L [Chitinophagaceae bacterium]
MIYTVLVLLIVLFPLAGFLFPALWGRSLFKKSAGPLTVVLMTFSFLLSAYFAYLYFFEFGYQQGAYRRFLFPDIPWLEFSGALAIRMGAYIDAVSVMMLLTVTFVSLMVHVYSLWYMKHQERYAAYFAYLSLFTFSMLGLVLSSNIFQMYFFWELVGVSSFLLIGFYYQKPAAAAAAKKAFIVTRFADVGFFIGILILSFSAGSMDFETILHKLTTPGSDALNTAAAQTFLGISALSWGAALVFMGAAGKSALFPLHIWLPDAMEGPTPVSALIHAATMVVAGVFLIARLFPLYAITVPGVQEFIAWVSAVTALMAALIACVQTDIKRILAFSTMSQIGLMMLSLGVAKYEAGPVPGYTASLFHLFTHALFKSLLFLCAGIMIHFVHNNSIWKMGGLRKYLPLTHLFFLAGCLAISGIPPFSGFFSKEEILLAAYRNYFPLYVLVLITSAVTAFYMFRMYFRTFWFYNLKGPTEKETEIEVPALIPLVLLAIGAVLGGFIPFGNFVTSDGHRMPFHFDVRFSLLPVILNLAGIFVAMWFYKTKNKRSDIVQEKAWKLYLLLSEKFYVDHLYEFITRKVIFQVIGRSAAWFDKNIVDGMVNLSGEATQYVSAAFRKLQSGKVQLYALYFLLAILALALITILK